LDLAIDLDAARTLYQKAAEGGNEYAQRRLGTACEFGELALAIDLDAARTWYHEAAERGETLAQHRLFWAYKDGTLGLKADLEAARMWLQKAFDGDSEDDDDEEDELVRLLRITQVGYNLSTGTVGAATVIGVDGGGDGRGGGARIVAIGLVSGTPLGTAF